jgi:hypothetical protein
MAFEIELEYLIFADIEFVFDWWTDLSPQDTKLAKPLKSREIISKSPTQILLRDEEVILGRKMIFDVRVTLNSQEHSWIAEYSGKIAKATSEYKLISEQPSEDSRRVLSVTRLRYHTTVYPKGFFTNLFSPLIRPFVKKVFSEEMAGFKRAIEQEYAAIASSPPSSSKHES